MESRVLDGCHLLILGIALPWLLSVYAAAKYIKYATEFVGQMKREKPADWARLSGEGAGYAGGMQRAGPLFWVIVCGSNNQILDPFFLHLVWKPRLFGILCILMFSIGIFALALLPVGCIKM
jgi:hypothetical protein